MDIGLREWLIIGGGLVILLIILDGWRRVKSARSALRMDIDESFSDLPDDDSNPELPHGGARVRNADGDLLMGEPGTHIEPSFDTPLPMDTTEARPSVSTRSHDAQPSDASVNHIEPVFVHNDPLPESVEKPLHAEQIPMISDFPDVEQPIGEPSRLAEQHSDLDRFQPTHSANYQPQTEAQVSVTEETIPNEEIFANVLASESRSEFNLEPDPFAKPQQKPIADKVSAAGDPLFAPLPESSLSQTDKKSVEPIRLSEKTIDEDPLISDLDDELLRPVSSSYVMNAPESNLKASPSQAPNTDPKVHSLPIRNEEPSSYDIAASLQPEHDNVAIAETTKVEVAVEPVIAEPQTQVADVFKQPDEINSTSQLQHARVDRGPTQSPDPENSLVLMVVANNPEGFSGQSMLQLVLACGMRFGSMDIFHRFEDGIDQGAVQFSVANATEDGSFDLEGMSEQRIRAVTFFMSMNEPREVMNAFDCMFATAETIARHLNGDLLDENRNMVRAQTQEHYRQRVRDFEMQTLRRRSG